MSVFANESLLLREQKVIVEKIAKEVRKELWEKGHDEVQSEVSVLSKVILDKLVEEGKTTYDQLNKDDIRSFYKCVNSPKSCTLFSIDITSDYMSGYGHDRHWVLLDPTSGLVSYYVKQSVYSE